MPVIKLILFLFIAATAQAQLQPFFAPAQPAGSMNVKLHPMENVSSGTPVLVTFGVPFTRGSMPYSALATVRVMHNGVEVPAYVEGVTPWRHIANGAVNGQSVRIARVQIQHTFSVVYPNAETVTVEWGGTARSLNVTTMVNPMQGWHTVTSGSFVAADGIMEPDVYALLPKEVLAQGVLSLKRHIPFSSNVAETRDDPWDMDDVEHWPEFEEVDRAFKNNFYTSINQDDPLVTQYAGGALIDYKRDSEPWLYDRASTFFVLYLRSGFLRPLREAVRATQFYRSKLYGPNISPATSAGLFSLKATNPMAPNGGNDAMYSYAECFAYDLWLTGNPESVEPIRWVAATVNALAENSHWSPSLGAWTERHTSLATLANVVAYEVTGEALYRETVLRHTSDYIWHQNGADGLLPENRLDGGLYHYGSQHGDGQPNVLVASHWMTTLTVDAMVRAYGVTEDPAIAGFVIRAARFQSTALMFDDEHDFDTYPGALRYPGYMIRFDGAPDVLDGHDTTAINHALDVASSVAWGAYFQHLMHGVPDPAIEAAARDLYFAFDVGVNHWIRPAAPPLGFTAFRVNPARKFCWEFRPSSSFGWVMSQINVISPPPVVTITSPMASQRFTAPATILIEATATTPNSTIAKVEFFDGATKLGEDTEAPYTYLWTGVIADTQGHVISAKATTALGVEGTSVGVPLDVRSPTAPTLTINTPIVNQVFTAPATVTFTTTVVPQGSSAVSHVVFMRGYVPEYTDTQAPFTYTLTNELHGDYEFQIMAFDVLGGYDIESVKFKVQTPTPPTVTLTAPLEGTQTTGGAVLQMRATASAPGSEITRVVFRADDVPIGEDDTAPYELNYNVSTRWALGNHVITARAFETNGGFASSSANIQMITLDPIAVTFDTPAQNAEFNFPTPIVMQASANAPGATIARVEFYANGQLAGTDTEAPYTASYVPTSIRQWEVMARAYDSYGRYAEARRLVHVTGPSTPLVTMTSPASGSVLVAPAMATLSADASVNAATITSVRFYEGSTLIGEDTTEPFSVTTPALTLGDHSFYAMATASTGRTAYSSSVIVTVGGVNAPVAVVTSPRYSGPQVGASFETVRFAAGAQHTGGLAIQRVEFWLDNAKVGEDFTAPYEYDWTVGTRTGYHELVARAVDVNEVFANSSRVGFELIIPPIIGFTSPTASATLPPGNPVTLSASVIQGTYSLVNVRFYVNDVLVGTDTTAPYSVEWTPPSTGSFNLTARVQDSRLDRWSPPLTVTGGYSAQQQWWFAHFGVHHGSGDAADDADPDGDGLANLMEWMLAADPEQPDPAKRPVLVQTGEHAIYTFARNDEIEPGTPVYVCWSADLQTWHDVPVPAATTGPNLDGVLVVVSENGTAPDTITVMIPRSNSPTGNVFMRLSSGAP